MAEDIATLTGTSRGARSTPGRRGRRGTSTSWLPPCCSRRGRPAAAARRLSRRLGRRAREPDRRGGVEWLPAGLRAPVARPRRATSWPRCTPSRTRSPTPRGAASASPARPPTSRIFRASTARRCSRPPASRAVRYHLDYDNDPLVLRVAVRSRRRDLEVLSPATAKRRGRGGLMYHGERFNAITHLVGATLALAGPSS